LEVAAMNLDQIPHEYIVFAMGAIVSLMVWVVRQVMAIDKKLTKLEEHRENDKDFARDLTRQGDQITIHAKSIANMEAKLDLILRKMENLEQNCLLHRLLQRADPEKLLQILQAVSLDDTK
jgi:hypothetical protein